MNTARLKHMTTALKKTHTNSHAEKALGQSVSEHFVLFCETDAFLVNVVSEFTGAGLKAGDACIVLATGPHRESLEERLKGDGLDVAAALVRGQYVSIDAAAILPEFMIDGSPDPERFARVVGGIIAQAAKDQRHVRIFGEMVALLWADGNQEAAIRLEELWNDLGKTYSFSLFCAYPMHGFGREAYEGEFTEICKQHSRVIPTESYTALLQQRANLLEVEIAERKAAEERLRVHLAAIVESSDDAIISKNLEGIITSWNTAAERMYGYSAQEIVGQPITLLFAPDQQDEFMQIMAHIRRGERVDHYEARRVRKDGTRLTVSVTVSPIKDSTGTIIGASAIARDITEQKRLEAKFRHLFDSNLAGVFISDFAGTFLDANNAFLDLLGYTRAELRAGIMQRDALTPPEFHYLSQNALKALQETGGSGTYEKEYLHKSGKRIPVLVAVTRIEYTDTCIGFVLDISERKALDLRKDEFISMASHELKTPVTSLKGFAQLLKRRLKKQGMQQEEDFLARMEGQIDRLTRLVNDLLDVSKIQAGKLDYAQEVIDLDALIRDLVEMFQQTNVTHSIVLQGATHHQVIGDRDRLGQVFINLLSNAIKYSPHAEQVEVSLASPADEVCVSVRDFGIGISKEDQSKIFDRFYRVYDVHEKKVPGLGMGLYIVQEIIRQHGGEITVTSEVGQGTTFTVSLPLINEQG
jgi:PAS domain S-box-containing protein